MTNEPRDAPTHSGPRIRHLLVAGLGLLAVVIAAVAYLCASRVPEGEIGLALRGSEAPAILAPGVHWHGPATRIVRAPSAEERHAGLAAVLTPEGASLAVPFTLTLDLRRASPEGLATLVRHLESGGDLKQAVQRALEEALQAEGARGPVSPALEKRMTPLGLVEGSLQLGPPQAAASLASQGVPNPVRDAYEGPRWPVLVVGLDGADWDLIDPLIDQGRLPHLKALRDRGAWGTLRSMSPTLSPILWTTLATGRPPEDHGVLDFLVSDPVTGSEMPISRLSRKVKAIWNIASDVGITNATVGWWASWPAEPVLGAMITDRLAYSLFDLPLDANAAGVVHPPSLLAELSGGRVEEEEVGDDEVRAIVDVDPATIDRARKALRTSEGFQDPVGHLIKILASTGTYHQAALHVMGSMRPRLALVYYQGIDEVNHRFAHFMPPRMSLVAGEPEPRRRSFERAVPRFYELQDRLLGELVAAAGPEAVVMVISDHGFANGGERPLDVPPDIEGRPGLWHTLDGVLIAAGPPVRAGALPRPVELLDVMPTLLALLGLPRADDMPGRVVEELFAPGARPSLDVAVASYDAIGSPVSALASTGGSPVEEEMLARLRALGYIESGGSTASPQAAGSATATYHVNAGILFLQKNELERAAAEFKRARDMAPHFDAPRLGLAQVALMRGLPAEALPLLEETLEKGDPQPVLLLRAARVYIQASRQKEGIAVMESLKGDERREAFRRSALGMLRESLGETDAALRWYREALAADPGQVRALQGAYRIMKRRGELQDLAAILEKSLAAERPSTRVMAANWLALTLEAQGRRQDARRILERTAAEAPRDVMTLVNWGSMLVREDRLAEALPLLSRAKEVQPGSLEVLVNLVVAHGKMGNLAGARAAYADGEKALGGRAERQLENAMAFAAFLNGDFDLASRHAARSLEIDPRQQDTIQLKARIDQGRREAR